MIKKMKAGCKVTSEKGKNFGGPYKSKAAAERRLRQVEFFKHRKEKLCEAIDSGRPSASAPRAFSRWTIQLTAAFRRAAAARRSSHRTLEHVVESQFFTRANRSAAAEENAALRLAHVEIWFATVIDVLRAVPIPSVDDPTAIETGETDAFGLAALDISATCLGVIDSVSCVLDHDVAARNDFPREHAKMMDRRSLDPKAESGCRRIDEATF